MKLNNFILWTDIDPVLHSHQVEEVLASPPEVGGLEGQLMHISCMERLLHRSGACWAGGRIPVVRKITAWGDVGAET